MKSVVANTTTKRRGLYVRLGRFFNEGDIARMREDLMTRNLPKDFGAKEIAEYLVDDEADAEVRTDEVIAWEIDTEAGSDNYVTAITATAIIPLAAVFFEDGDFWTDFDTVKRMTRNEAVFSSFADQLYLKGWLNPLFPAPSLPTN